MRKSLLIFVIFLFASILTSAQQNNIWYFGFKAGLDFNASPGLSSPVAIDNSAMNADEGCASICDKNGQLLFYTNGVTVYNRKHQVMQNGDNLAGHLSALQSCVIVPMPGNAYTYYIFTSDALENNFANGYCYSVVDMRGDNGNGSVVSKNILLGNPSTERMVAVRHINGSAVWVITNDNNSNTFRAWLVDCNGLQPGPVVSNSGIILDQDPTVNVGMMKVSPDGKQLCQTHFSEISTDPSFVQLFDFDNATGVLSNPRSVGFPVGQIKTCEYSPDSKLLYLVRASANNAIDQVEATLPTAAGIIASRITINTGNNAFFGVQLAPDQKIYLCQQSAWLGAINKPNTKGLGCDYQEKQIQLKNSGGFLGLPSFINDLSYNPNNGFTYIIVDSCSGTVQFQGVTSMIGTLQWRWNFGDGNTASTQNPVHTFNPPGDDYLISVEITSSLGCESVKSSRIIRPSGIITQVDFDYFANCDSGYVRFINKNLSIQGGGQFSWDFGDGTFSTDISPTHSYSQPGNYQVKLKRATSLGCLDNSKTKTVTMPGLPVTISADQTIFIGQKVQLFINGAGNTFQWSPPTGLSNPFAARPFAAPVQDITYTAKVINNNGCTGIDSVHITVVELDGIYVPTAFTPNNDGRNDDIKPIFGTKFTLKEFSIFSRWGERIFTTGTRDQGWNGKMNGLEQNSGVYVWILKYLDDKGRTKEKKGTVILLR